jgi:hypothetical protein
MEICHRFDCLPHGSFGLDAFHQHQLDRHVASLLAMTIAKMVHCPTITRRLGVPALAMTDNKTLVRLRVSQSKALLMEQYVTHTFDKNPTAADPRPMVLTQIRFNDRPKMVDRRTITFTSDFKATSRLVLSMTTMFNAYEHRYLVSRQLTFTAASANANVNTGRSTIQGDLNDFRTNGLATNSARAVKQQRRRQLQTHQHHHGEPEVRIHARSVRGRRIGHVFALQIRLRGADARHGSSRGVPLITAE